MLRSCGRPETAPLSDCSAAAAGRSAPCAPRTAVAVGTRSGRSGVAAVLAGADAGDEGIATAGGDAGMRTGKEGAGGTRTSPATGASTAGRAERESLGPVRLGSAAVSPPSGTCAGLGAPTGTAAGALVVPVVPGGIGAAGGTSGTADDPASIGEATPGKGACRRSSPRPPNCSLRETRPASRSSRARSETGPASGRCPSAGADEGVPADGSASSCGGGTPAGAAEGAGGAATGAGAVAG